MSISEKAQMVENAKENAKFLELRIVLKMFGVVILDYTFPPAKSK